jgi:O-antigen ligase
LGFGITILYILMLFIRPMEWVEGLKGFEFVGFGLMDFIAVVGILTTAAELGKGEWKAKSAPQNMLMLGLFFACLMSHVRHGYREMFIDTFVKFGKILILYYFVSINVNTLKRLKILIGVLLASCAFFAIHGIMQWHSASQTGFGGLPIMYIAYYNQYRVLYYGFFQDPNDFALIFITFIPFVLSSIIRRGSAAPKRVYSLILCAAMLYVVYRTNSRGGWLALAVTFIAFFGTIMKKKKLGLFIGGMTILGLLMVAPSRMGTVSTEEGSARGRLVAWADGNRMLKPNPIFGVGFDRFTEYSERGKVAHNSYVHAYAEIGLFGYFFWLALLLASLKDAYVLGNVKTDNPEHAEIARLALICVSVLIGYMASSFFLSRSFVPPLYVLLAMMAAIRTIHDRDYEPVPKAFRKTDLRRVLILELSSIPALYIFLRFAI